MIQCLKRLVGAMPVVRIEVFQSADGWRWRMRARNGEIVAQSESYTRRESAEDTATMLTGAKLVLEER